MASESNAMPVGANTYTFGGFEVRVLCAGFGKKRGSRRVQQQPARQHVVHRYPDCVAPTPQTTTTWEEDSVYGCVCDSDWDVGIASGQRQQAEWFGADCSRRKPRLPFTLVLWAHRGCLHHCVCVYVTLCM